MMSALLVGSVRKPESAVPVFEPSDGGRIGLDALATPFGCVLLELGGGFEHFLSLA